MNSDISQKKTDKLARIRENQRKSRAQKQEHIRELEQQLAWLKKQAQQKDVEHRLSVQKFEAENRKLKHLLSSSGVPSSAVEGYLRTVEDPAMSHKVAVPALRRFEGTSSVSQCQKSRCIRPCSTEEQSNGDKLHSGQLKGLVPASEPREKPEPELPQGQAESVRSQSVCGCLPNDDLFPSNEDVLNTTLCAIAEELISQYNTRGVDMAEIQKRLWNGFSKGGATGEGCRVQNHILFQVLDEISNN